MLILAGLGAAALAMFLSAVLTPFCRGVAFRWRWLDTPGGHKAHARPVPLLGGTAVLLAIVLPTLLATALAPVWSATGVPGWLPEAWTVHLPGVVMRAPMALGILAGAVALHLVGLIDDRRSLGPWTKLAAQAAVSIAVVVFCGVRVLTVAGPAVSIAVSILWLVAVINAFNFLDNMDGLAAGVGAIAAAGLLAASAAVGQLFVPAWLCLILGALLGFLPQNYPPARTFLGDAGSLVIGYLLGVVSCLATYVRPGAATYLYGVFVPVVMMAVPLYDMCSVIFLRLRAGRNPMVGDRRHFSHRLLQRGFSPARAVWTIYLCTAATALGACLLARVRDATGAILVFVQTVVVLGIVALLEAGERRS